MRYLNLLTCICNVSAIDCNLSVYNFTFKVKNYKNRTVIPSLLGISFGICEIYSILNYPKLVTYFGTVTANDCHFLVYNFTLKVKFSQKRTEISFLLVINFGYMTYLPF